MVLKPSITMCTRYTQDNLAVVQPPYQSGPASLTDWSPLGASLEQTFQFGFTVNENNQDSLKKKNQYASDLTW